MTSKHTPGPWSVVDNPRTGIEHHRYEIHSRDDGAVCFLAYRFSDGKIEEANARLIAAAPETAAERDKLKEINTELLASCDAAISLWDDLYSGMSDEGEREVFETMRAAIAKARGEG